MEKENLYLQFCNFFSQFIFPNMSTTLSGGLPWLHCLVVAARGDAAAAVDTDVACLLRDRRLVRTRDSRIISFTSGSVASFLQKADEVRGRVYDVRVQLRDRCVLFVQFPDSTVMADVPADTQTQFSALLDDSMPVGRTWQLLWRASRDGATPADFHRLCDFKGPTMTLVKDTTGCVFGGYAAAEWGPGGVYVAEWGPGGNRLGHRSRLDDAALVISVVSPTHAQPTRVSAPGCRALSVPTCGPVLGMFWIYDNLHVALDACHCSAHLIGRSRFTPVDVETWLLL